MSIIKTIELFFRRIFLTTKEKQFTGVYVVTPSNVLQLSSKSKILLLRQDRIGDVLVSTGIIRVLHQQYPNAQIDIILSKNNRAVKHAIAPYVKRFYIYEKTLMSGVQIIRRARKEQYDVIIDLMDNTSATSTIFVRYIAAKCSVGIFKRNASVYTHCVPLLDRSRVHIIDRIAQLLLPFGIDPNGQDLRPVYNLSQIDKDQSEKTILPNCKKLIINISGSRDNVWWGRENFIDFITFVQQQYPDLHIYVASSQVYNEDLQAITSQTSTLALPITTSFHEYVSMLSTADILVTPDTSIVHIASAFSIPSLTFYLQTDYQLLPWYPYKTPYRALVAKPDEHTIKIFPAEQAFKLFSDLYEEIYPKVS